MATLSLFQRLPVNQSGHIHNFTLHLNFVIIRTMNNGHSQRFGYRLIGTGLAAGEAERLCGGDEGGDSGLRQGAGFRRRPG